MKKIIFSITIAFFGLFLSASNIAAIYNPTSVPNNKFGMHIVNISDLEDVAKLANSSGGDWGYVTLVIQKGERNTRHWQEVFDKMRRLRLIPIIRVATAPNGNTWETPNPDEIDGWVSFFNSLNWVIKNRYIIIGNETNHAKEWGGKIDPIGYSKYLKTFSDKLKSASSDYFIMSAGLDASAPNGRETMDEALYLRRMLQTEPNLFDNIDGWSSHSYPAGFSGSADGYGKGTVRTYQWELNYLKTLGISKNLPVFITETGWVHNANRLFNLSTPESLGPKYEYAFNNAWNDPNIVAVTPFIFNYQDSLFDTFSWKKKDGGFYDFYYKVQNLPKISGHPQQDNSGNIVSALTPQIGGINETFYSVIFLKNNGQAIWNKDNLKIKSETDNEFTIESVFPHDIEPNQIGAVFVKGKFPSSGLYKNYFQLVNEDGLVTNKYEYEVNVIPFEVNINSLVERVKNFFFERK